MKEAGAILLVKHSDEYHVLVIERFDGKGFSLPCGFKQEGESLVVTAIRECAEETGINVGVINDPFIGIDVVDNTVVSTYYGTFESGTLLECTDEGIPKWVTLDKLLDGPYAHYNKRLLKHFNLSVPLVGKFHSHLTVSGDDINILKQAAAIAKGKLTVIDLYAQSLLDRECMITNHFVTGYRGFDSANQIITHLQQVASEINKTLNVEVVRIKLEHELFHPRSLESQITQSLYQYDYTECHIKVLIPPSIQLSQIRELAELFSWRLSSNPFSVSNDGIVQFINKRFYTNDYNSCDILQLINDSVDDMIFKLYNTGVDIIECKVETAVYDSNADLDAWWAKT